MKVTHLRTFGAITILVASVSLAAAPAEPSERAGRPRADLSLSARLAELAGREMTLEKSRLGAPWRKVSRVLREAAAMPPSAPILSAASASGGRAGFVPLVVREDGALRVSIQTLGAGAESAEALAAAGVQDFLADEQSGTVEGWLAPDRLGAVAGLERVASIRPAIPPYVSTGSTASQGDALLRADVARTHFGLSGAGVTVGVLSDSVDGISSAQFSGDLPPGVQVLKAGQGAGEGTAMLEIVHDLAPGADLAFYGPSSSADMITGINQLAAAGARVIVDDLTFFDQPHFEEGPVARAIDALAARGIVYATSAGNFAEPSGADRGAYTGDFSGGGSLGAPTHDVHLFSPGHTTQSITVFPQSVGVVFLQWADRFGAAADDYDLYVVDSNMNIVAQGDDTQNGTGDPAEMAVIDNRLGLSPLELFVIVDRFSGAPRRLKLFYSGLTDIEFGTSGFSIAGHANASGALTVAAINASNPNTEEIAPYSSQGPCDLFFPAVVNEDKPDLTAIDGVSVSGAAGFPSPFFGTSAAAPHVGAVAALLLEHKPGLDFTLVKEALQATAADRGAPGLDPIYGAGLLDADAAVTAIDGGTAPTITGLTTDLLGDHLAVSLSGSDADADVAEAEIVLKDGAGGLLGGTGRLPASHAGMPTFSDVADVTGLGAFATAVTADLTLTDSKGNVSAAATGDFSQASPGGPALAFVKYSRGTRTLKMTGSAFSGVLAVEINGVNAPGAVKAKPTGLIATTKGSLAKLSLRKGANRVRVFANGLHSNIFILTL
ncbi:MAG: S8 family serine peptidase [Acidobacteria bacterium]|nr:S8 family serine peptidase [Acidobacteriota bacterium]